MTVQEYLGSLFEIRINAHIAHLQTNSFAKHKALDELYNGVVDLADEYAEAYQGIYGIITNYPQITIQENLNVLVYLRTHINLYRRYRLTVKETELQQMIDNNIEFFDKIIYKLKFLN